MVDNINVVKRNGRGKEPLNIEKIHEMVEYACEDVSGVSSSQVEVVDYNSMMDITTDEIQQILIKSFRFNFTRLQTIIDANQDYYFIV